MYNESSKKATMKYIKENLEEIRFRVKKGEKDRYKQLAARANMSLAELLKKAIEEYADNHNL